MNDNAAPRDHAADSDANGNATLERNLKSRSTWRRLFFMIVVALLYAVSRIVLAAVVLIQFFTLLFTGRTNHALGELGQSLATYTYQIVLYLTFNTDQRPYPFDQAWPKQSPDFRAADPSEIDAD